MKIMLVALFGFLVFQSSHSKSFIGSVWAKKITKTASDTLTFKSNGSVLEHISRLDYTFHSSYKLSGDTVTINGKDNVHTTDLGKVNIHWVSTYLIKSDGLYMIGYKVFSHGRWYVSKIKNSQEPYYKKTM